MGSCPCPRCLIPKHRTDQLGTKRDQHRRISLARVDDLHYKVNISCAREMIYQKNCAVDSSMVETLLKPHSLVPTEVKRNYIHLMAPDLPHIYQNAFSQRLSHLGFNLFSVFLVDFMHEFELGVWKKVFLHLLRILECVKGAINILDQR